MRKALWIATVAAQLLALGGAALGGAGAPPSKTDLARRTFPPRYEKISLTNPWGEELFVHDELPGDFGAWIVAAAGVYVEQGVRFDGWLGSDRDGVHYRAAVDGEDLAYVGDPAVLGFRELRDGVVDDLGERSWVCLDLALHAITLAGFPLREAMIDDHALAPEDYAGEYGVVITRPGTPFFFRRVPVMQTYFRRAQHYADLRIGLARIDDPDYRPPEPFRPGDLLFLGHHGAPADKGGPWRAQHMALVVGVDERGMPDELYNLRASGPLVERFRGEIGQLRIVADQGIRYRRYCDRYSLVGLGRIVSPHRAPEPPSPVDSAHPAAPVNGK